MAKKVLFQPEDFDKPQKKNNKKKLAWAVGICAVLALVGIGGYALLAPKTLDSAAEIDSATPAVVAAPDRELVENKESSSAEISDDGNTSISEVDATEQKSEKSIPETTKDQSPAPVAEPNSTVNQGATQIEGESLEQEAMKVIRGDYGDGKVRRSQLGNRYQAVQNRVNQLKREGAF